MFQNVGRIASATGTLTTLTKTVNGLSSLPYSLFNILGALSSLGKLPISVYSLSFLQLYLIIRLWYAELRDELTTQIRRVGSAGIEITVPTKFYPSQWWVAKLLSNQTPCECGRNCLIQYLKRPYYVQNVDRFETSTQRCMNFET